MRSQVAMLSLLLVATMPAAAQHVHSTSQGLLEAEVSATSALRRRNKELRSNHRMRMERAGYKKVSSLVNFPSFFPGIGVLYVKPETLPAGPFLAYDRKDRLVSTIYMISVDDITNKRKFELKAISAKADHVTLYYNSGHPGVEMPHYHFVVWHVSKKNEARVAK
jgi:hypothetical protein